MKNSTLLLSLFILSLQLSCSKGTFEEPKFPKKQITDYLTNGTKYTLSYDDNDRIKKIRRIQGTSNELYKEFFYENDLLIREARKHISVSHSFDYHYSADGNLVSIFDHRVGGINNTFFFEVVERDGNRIISFDFKWAKDSSLVGRFESEYDGQNLSTFKGYALNTSDELELTTTTTFEYDNKINPFRFIGFYRVFEPGFYSKNNIVEQKTIDFEGKTTVTNFTYEYDGKYPTTAMVNVVNRKGKSETPYNISYTYE